MLTPSYSLEVSRHLAFSERSLMIPYQEEPTSSLARNAWARGHLTSLELLRIAAWKSARGLAWLSLNTEEDIESQTATAIDHLRAWRGRQMAGVADPDLWSRWEGTARSAIGIHAETGLLKLSGVGYPMATAILTILDPEVWPVMDKLAVRSVFGSPPPDTSPSAWRWQRQWADAYACYARHLAVVGRRCWGAELNIHKLDQRAMRASMKGGQLPPGWSFSVLPLRHQASGSKEAGSERGKVSF
jgi:hypothetical protein